MMRTTRIQLMSALFCLLTAACGSEDQSADSDSCTVVETNADITITCPAGTEPTIPAGYDPDTCSTSEEAGTSITICQAEGATEPDTDDCATTKDYYIDTPAAAQEFYDTGCTEIPGNIIVLNST